MNKFSIVLAIAVVAIIVVAYQAPSPALHQSPPKTENMMKEPVEKPLTSKEQVIDNPPFLGETSVKIETLWKINHQPNVEELEKLSKVASSFNFSSSKSTPLIIEYDSNYLDLVEENELISLPLPISYAIYNVKINKKSTYANYKQISGSLADVGEGFSFSISYGESWINGEVTTPEGLYSIKTIYGLSVLIEDLPSHPH